MNTHKFVHENLGNQIDGAAVVTNPGLHARLEAAWNEDAAAFPLTASTETTRRSFSTTSTASRTPVMDEAYFEMVLEKYDELAEAGPME